MSEKETKTIKLVREEDELIGGRIKCEFDVVWYKRDFETEEEVQEFMDDSGGMIEHVELEFYDSRIKDLEIVSEEILEFVDAKIYVCHKCGKARRVEPRGIVKWPECDCIGQTTFDYETVPRAMGEAKEILEGRYKRTVELYREQDRGIDEFEYLIEEYWIKDRELNMEKVMEK